MQRTTTSSTTDSGHLEVRVGLKAEFGWLSYYVAKLEPTPFKVAFAFVFAFLARVIGMVDEALWAFLGLFLIDTITGYKLAAKRGKATSERLRKGVWKLLLYLVVILAGALLDIVVFGYVHTRGAYYLSVGYCAAAELKSILENVQALGGRVPVFLVAWIDKIERRGFDGLDAQSNGKRDGGNGRNEGTVQGNHGLGERNGNKGAGD